MSPSKRYATKLHPLPPKSARWWAFRLRNTLNLSLTLGTLSLPLPWNICVWIQNDASCRKWKNRVKYLLQLSGLGKYKLEESASLSKKWNNRKTSLHLDYRDGALWARPYHHCTQLCGLPQPLPGNPVFLRALHHIYSWVLALVNTLLWTALTHFQLSS